MRNGSALSTGATGEMRSGIRIGIDVGTVRVGIARSDPQGLLAVPVETLKRELSTAADVDKVAEFVLEWHVLEVIVGLPRSLSGVEGTAAEAVRKYAVQIARRVAPVPVRVVDERLSTVTAHRALREAGVRGRRHRPVVDQAAAVVILQSALDAERASGRAPGSIVDPGLAPDGPEPG
jgi:putative Holliday junction resolvase